MPLFHVENPERPMYVVACDYNQAHRAWKKQVATENEALESEVDMPAGILFVCEDSDLLINGLICEQQICGEALNRIAELEAERCDTIAEHKDCINRLQDTVAELRAIIVRLEAAEKARGK